MKFRKLAVCAAAIMCAAAVTAVPASAALTTVTESGFVKSTSGMFLVMVYSDGSKDADTKSVTNYAIDMTKIATVEVTVTVDVRKGDMGDANVGSFTNNWGGALVMSSVGTSYNHNWNDKQFWGVNDEDFGLQADAGKPVVFNKVADGEYKAVWTLSDNDKVLADCTFCQFAIQDWGADEATVKSIVMKDADGKEIISYDSNGKASLELKDISVKPEGAAEETKAEETKAEETTAAEETKAEETTAEDTSSETTAPADEDDGAEYVSTFDKSKVKVADTTVDKYFDGTYLFLRDENGLDALDLGEGLDPTSVYGIKFILDYDEADIENGIWFGGGIGANSNSTGWKQFGWSYTEGEQDLTMDLDSQSITWLNDAPIFQADDTYCQLWIQNWGGEWAVKEAQILDKDGKPITFDAAAAVDSAAEEVTTVDTIAPAPVTSDKDNPNTGIADVAAVAGLAVAAAGAVVLTKKRK